MTLRETKREGAQKALAIMENIDKLDFFKSRTLLLKRCYRERKDKLIQHKAHPSHLSSKELLPRRPKRLLQINMKMTSNSICKSG